MKNREYEEIMARIRMLYFKGIFKGDFLEKYSIEMTNTICGLHLVDGAFRVAILALSQESNVESVFENLLAHRSGLLEEPDLYELVVFPFELNVVLILNYNSGVYENIENKLFNIFRNLREDKICDDIVLAIGSEQNNFEEIAQSYQKSKLCAFERLMFGSDRVYISEDIKWSPPNNCKVLNVDDEHRLINALDSQDHEVILMATMSLLDSVVNQARITPQFSLLEFYRILELFKPSIERFEAIKGIDRQHYFMYRKKEIEEVRSFEEIYDVFSNIIRDLMSVKNSSEYSNRSVAIVRKMKRYIEENYMFDISNSELATVMNLNKHYASDLFKRVTGITIRQYLINQRMERVKLLLRDSNYTIAEIAKKTGYSDNKYLSVQFKKRYGITPGVYRQMNLNK